jgi:hypothetical protein
MYCEKHDEVDYWACPHCLDEANAKVEKLRKPVGLYLKTYADTQTHPTASQENDVVLEMRQALADTEP